MLPYSIRINSISTNHSRRKSMARHRTSWYSKCSNMLPLARRIRSLISVPVWDRWYCKWPARFPSRHALASRRPIHRPDMQNEWIWYFDNIWAGLVNDTVNTSWSRVIFLSTSIAKRSRHPHWCLSIILHLDPLWIISWKSDLPICETVHELSPPNRFVRLTFALQIGKCNEWSRKYTTEI